MKVEFCQDFEANLRQDFELKLKFCPDFDAELGRDFESKFNQDFEAEDW